MAAEVKTFHAVLRNLMYGFICRFNDSENEIISSLSNIRFSLIPAVETLVMMPVCKTVIYFLSFLLYMFMAWLLSGP